MGGPIAQAGRGAAGGVDVMEDDPMQPMSRSRFEPETRAARRTPASASPDPLAPPNEAAAFPAFLFALVALLAATPAGAQVRAQVWPSKITVTTEPGKPARQSVLISNLGADPVVVRVRASDWTLSPEGELALVPLGQTEHSLAGCLSFSPTSFSLAPGEARDVSVTLTLPPDGPPTRWGVLLQETRPAVPRPGRLGPLAVAELGTTLYASRSPEGAARAELSSLDITPAGRDSVRVRVELRNEGDRHFYAGGEVTVQDSTGASLGSASLSRSVVLPGADRFYTCVCPARHGSGLLHVVASLDTGDPYLLVGEKTFLWPRPGPETAWLGVQH